MQIHIKNMVCQRCIVAVEKLMESMDLELKSIHLGEVNLATETLDNQTLEALDKALIQLGFERIDDKKSKTIHQIKSLIIQKIHHQKLLDEKNNWSYILSQHLNFDYSYLSHLFSSVEGITIEQFIILQKIEKAKELLIYDEFNINEIAHQLGYGNISHLSAQFKKVTGFAPSIFKKQQQHSRKALDKL